VRAIGFSPSNQQLPVRQQRAISGVERIEPFEAERRPAPQLDGAQRRARSTLGVEVTVDQREAVAPGEERAEGRVDDLVA